MRLASVVVAVWFLALSCSAQASEKDNLFHEPKTSAEQALANILKIEHEDENLAEFVMISSDDKNAKNFSSLFTKDLLRAWRESYREISKQSEGLIDINFLTCSQESYSSYDYYTVKTEPKTAYIYTISHPSSKEDGQAVLSSGRKPYRMIKEDETWKLDGVYCAGDWSFKTDFNFTR